MSDQHSEDISEHPVHTHQRDPNDEVYERNSSPDDFEDLVLPGGE